MSHTDNILHDGERELTVSTVRQLLRSQFPTYVEQTIRPAESGTVNRIFRLGDTLCLRFPRVAGSVAGLERELAWLPQLAPHVSIRIPQPVAQGKPSADYPFRWAIYEWLAGAPFAPEIDGATLAHAERLATFISELRQIDTADAPRSTRDRPLQQADLSIADAIEFLADQFDPTLLQHIWTTCVNIPPYHGEGVWLHGDLIPTNLLVENGMLTAVIDFGLVAVGDPAVDYIPAWAVLRGDARHRFRALLDIDEASWQRGRGFAFSQALRIVPYYHKSNPAFAEMGLATIREIVEDVRRKT